MQVLRVSSKNSILQTSIDDKKLANILVLQVIDFSMKAENQDTFSIIWMGFIIF